MSMPDVLKPKRGGVCVAYAMSQGTLQFPPRSVPHGFYLMKTTSVSQRNPSFGTFLIGGITADERANTVSIIEAMGPELIVVPCPEQASILVSAFAALGMKPPLIRVHYFAEMKQVSSMAQWLSWFAHAVNERIQDDGLINLTPWPEGEGIDSHAEVKESASPTCEQDEEDSLEARLVSTYIALIKTDRETEFKREALLILEEAGLQKQALDSLLQELGFLQANQSSIVFGFRKTKLCRGAAGRPLLACETVAIEENPEMAAILGRN